MNQEDQRLRSTQQRLLRVPVGSSIPSGWRFVQWVGKETNIYTGQWEDVVLCEFEEDTCTGPVKA